MEKLTWKSMPFPKEKWNVNTVFSVLLVLLPFLYQYRGIGSFISFGECILIPFIVWFLYKDGIWACVPTGKELIFYGIMLLGTGTALLAPHFQLAEALTIFLRLVFYAVLMTLAKKHFHSKTAIHFYYGVVLVLSLYLLLQVAVNKISGNYLPIYLNYNWLFPPEQRAQDLAVLYRWGYRASSLFLEPGYFVMFSIPFLCRYPFGKKSWKQYVPFAIVALAAFLSGAAASIGVLGIVCTFLYFKFLKQWGVSRKYAICIFAGLILVAGIVFLTADLAGGALGRLRSGGSFNQRITRGFLIFKELPLFRKLFGVGLNNIGSYVALHDIVTPFDESDRGYMCSMLAILNSGGLVGFGCFIAYLYSIGKRVWKYKAGLCLFLAILFLCSYESVLFSYRFAFCYVFLLPIMHQQAKREEKADMAKRSKATRPLKVLLVDNSCGGHHQSYIDGLISSREAKFITYYPKENPAAFKSYLCKDASRGMNILQYVKFLKKVYDIARKERVSLIHFLCVDTFYRYFGLGFGLLRLVAPVAVTAHHIRRSILRDISVKMIAGQVNSFVVHTESLQKDLKKMCLTNVEHVEYPQFNVVPQMEQAECKKKLGLPDTDAPVLLALGGTRQDKGLDILLEALQDVKSDFHLLIAGKEEDVTREQILELSESYPDRVTMMLQFLTDEEFAMCLNACDKVVLPYRRSFDGASGPLGEGVRFGKQIIGPEHGSVGSIITKNHLGSTFVTEDPEDLAAVIDAALRQDFVCDDAYTAYQQALDPKYFTEKYMGIYRKIYRI